MESKHRNNTIYNWVHKNGARFTGTKWDLHTTYNLYPSNVAKVIWGHLKSTGGWYIIRN